MRHVHSELFFAEPCTNSCSPAQGSRYLLGQRFSACFVFKLQPQRERGEKKESVKFQTKALKIPLSLYILAMRNLYQQGPHAGFQWELFNLIAWGVCIKTFSTMKPLKIDRSTYRT